MPILGAIVLLIQLCFAYHALKTGRQYWWLFVIMGFPVMGCLLYYFIEVFPSSRESRSAQKAARAISRALDPDRDLRARVADVEACGSVENRILLARECMEQRMHAEAAALYRSCLAGIHENRLDEALAELRVLADTFPGEEGRWRYGALLKRLGRAQDAQAVFRRMLRNAERLPEHYRDAQRDWLDMARQSMQS